MAGLCGSHLCSQVRPFRLLWALKLEFVSIPGTALGDMFKQCSKNTPAPKSKNWLESHKRVNCLRGTLKPQGPAHHISLHWIWYDLDFVCSYITIRSILTDPILVIIEYVPYGDLLGYLRKSRGLNDTYFKDPDVKPQTSLTSQQLMKFSWHVAEGMRYLSSKNVSLTLKFSNFFRRNYHFTFYVFAMQRGLCWTNDTNCIECFPRRSTPNHSIILYILFTALSPCQ